MPDSVPASRRLADGIDFTSSAASSESTYFQTRSVNGPFGVTAEFFPFDRVIDYMEKRAAPAQGYYRLVRHPYIRRLEAQLLEWSGYAAAICFSSAEAALNELGNALPLLPELGLSVPDGLTPPSDVPGNDAALVALNLSSDPVGLPAGAALFRDAAVAAEVFDRIRKRGAVLSARSAAWLMGEGDDPLCGAADAVARQLADMESAPGGLVYPSGMAALMAVCDLLLSGDKRRVVTVGHLYSDTHVLLAELPWPGGPVETEWLGVHEMDRLEAALDRGDVAMVMAETLTNPLCEVPDLPRIIAAAKTRGVPVVIDNTMATPANCRPLELGADVVVHSTSKYLSGGNEHGGGAVLATEAFLTPLAAQQSRSGRWMSPFEASLLQDCMGSFPKRMTRFNANGAAVAAHLRAHPEVARVFHPEEGNHAHLESFASVVSFEMKDSSALRLKGFYDALDGRLIRAPSLGSDETLICPYVMMTYYAKSDDYLRELRLPRFLIRVAVGCEADCAAILNNLDHALSIA